MSRLSVLAVIDSLGSGGTERSIGELAIALRQFEVDCTIAILRSSGDEGVEQVVRSSGVPIVELPQRGRVRALRRLVRAREPDVVHSMLYAANQATRAAMLGLRTPLMTSIVNTSYSSERRATRSTAAWKLSVVQMIDTVGGRLCVDEYHAVSESARDDAIANLHVRPDRVAVVKRGRPAPEHDLLDAPDREQLRHELGIAGSDRVVIAVGRHEHQKDHLTLLSAMEEVLAEHDDVRLLIAGRRGNTTAVVERAVEASAHADRIELLGHRGDVPALLSSSDVFVLTSRHEGLPGAVIEALAARLPVVASDIGPVREVIGDADGALLCPPGDAPAFARAIETLLDDPERRRELGAQGRERFEREFTIEASAAGMAALYHDVAQRGPRSVF